MFNETKCSLLSIGSRQTSTEPSDHQYTINGLSISSSSQQKDPGIIIILSSDLPWSHHISKIVFNATKYYACFADHSVPQTIQSPRKGCIYISLVRLQILYGSQIWRPMQLKDIKPVQRRATMLYSMIILPTIDQD